MYNNIQQDCLAKSSVVYNVFCSINCPKSKFDTNNNIERYSDILVITSSDQESYKMREQIVFLNSNNLLCKEQIYVFDSFDTAPYALISPTPEILFRRARVLTFLSAKSTTVQSKNSNISPKSQHNNQKPIILITSYQNLFHKLPHKDEFAHSFIQIIKGMNLNKEFLCEFLSKNGFNRVFSVTSQVEFSVRGEILDIVLDSKTSGYRINFAFNAVEKIRILNLETQRAEEEVDVINITRSSEILLNEVSIDNFCTKYAKYLDLHDSNCDNDIYNSVIFQSVKSARKFPGYENFLPLFYNKTANIIEYLDNPVLIHNSFNHLYIAQYEQHIIECYKKTTNKKSATDSALALSDGRCDYSQSFLKPDFGYFTADFLKEALARIEFADSKLPPLILPHNKSITNAISKIFLEKNQNNFEKLIASAKLALEQGIAPIICCIKTSSKEAIVQILKKYHQDYLHINSVAKASCSRINICLLSIDSLFSMDNYVFIADKDILGENNAVFTYENSKDRTKVQQNKLKNILSEFDHLEEGQLVVHKNHGVARFLGIEVIKVLNKEHDCLKLLYADDDKLYLPVENIELIKKYGEFDSALDKLGLSSWQRRKAKIKDYINEIAHELVAITAKRKLKEVESIALDIKQYDSFCADFGYIETEDQERAILDIKSDLESGVLMDRLICGDVGVGKTEVAMRAAFMVCANIKSKLAGVEVEYASASLSPDKILQPLAQVVVVVPTTVLCAQHSKRFKDRFEKYGIKVAHLARTNSKAENERIKALVKAGDVNILIATHAIFSPNIEFANLAMIIIDEEQHFGVKQKEYLKKLKTDVNILSLSATPIPRTLQMSIIGLKDLSIIATPPLNRLAIHSYVIEYNDEVIKDALLRERFRGGRSFYVVPRIEDIGYIERRLAKIAPELRYKIAHSKISAVEIDKIMQEFHTGAIDILICTAIIESGIDVPSANTMIIHRAEMFGLSQLYQLKGRIGRSNMQAFAYFTISSEQKVTPNAFKRLNIIQHANSLGSGFMIASHDMDIRGFGNLLGSEQSGKIKEVGVELYQEMLEEEMLKLRFKQEKLKAKKTAKTKVDASTQDYNEYSHTTSISIDTKTDLAHKSDIIKDLNESGETAVAAIEEITPNINLGISILIPSDYISDIVVKLSLYKKIGNLKTAEDVEGFCAEMIDRFGPIPKEFDNLLAVVKIKRMCINLGIKSLDAGSKGFLLALSKYSQLASKIGFLAQKYQSKIKIKPDGKIIFIEEVLEDKVIESAFNLLELLNNALASKC